MIIHTNRRQQVANDLTDSGFEHRISDNGFIVLPLDTKLQDTITFLSDYMPNTVDVNINIQTSVIEIMFKK